MEIKNLKPLNGNILVLDSKKEEVTAGGIVIPGTAQDEHIVKGTVISTSKIKLEDGSERDQEVEPGDLVMYSFTAGAGNAWDDSEDIYRVIKPVEILAKLV